MKEEEEKILEDTKSSLTFFDPRPTEQPIFDPIFINVRVSLELSIERRKYTKARIEKLLTKRI